MGHLESRVLKVPTKAKHLNEDLYGEQLKAGS